MYHKQWKLLVDPTLIEYTSSHTKLKQPIKHADRLNTRLYFKTCFLLRISFRQRFSAFHKRENLHHVFHIVRSNESKAPNKICKQHGEKAIIPTHCSSQLISFSTADLSINLKSNLIFLIVWASELLSSKNIVNFWITDAQIRLSWKTSRKNTRWEIFNIRFSPQGSNICSTICRKRLSTIFHV